MWCKLSDFRPHSSPDPLTRATLPPGEGIFCPYEIPPQNAEKPPPFLGAVLCSVFDYRYCLMASEALAGSSETEMVSFMLLLSQNLAAQAMNSSP